jgi:hypothetical protein
MNLVGFAALAATVLGLVAVLVEIGLKSPSAFLEIATDSEAFARSPAPLPAASTAMGGFRALPQSA